MPDVVIEAGYSVLYFIINTVELFLIFLKELPVVITHLFKGFPVLVYQSQIRQFRNDSDCQGTFFILVLR